MCVDCPEKKLVKFRFIGGLGKTHPAGPWGNHIFGAVYAKAEVFNNPEAYPYWEYVGELSEEEQEKYEAGDQVVVSESLDDPADRSKTLENTRIIIPEDMVREEISALDMERVNFMGMDVQMLRKYINNNGGKWKRDWEKNQLIDAALKL